MIDTGAAISLIKHDSLIPSRTFLNIKDVTTITGINPNLPISTLGSAKIHLSVNDLTINPRLHVINSIKISTPYDGILGDDFFQQQNAEISYKTKTINISDNIIPFNNTISNCHSAHLITLPPRSESVIQILVSNRVKEGLLESAEIADNVLLPNAIILADSNQLAKCTVINHNNCELKIPRPTIKLEPFKSSIVNSINYCPPNQQDNSNTNVQLTQNPSKRITNLFHNVRTEHLNSEETKSIHKICQEYQDIFHLPGDFLTCTTSVEHSIPTISQGPIFSKTYRYPKVHEEEVKKQINDMLDQGIIQNSNSPWSSPVWVVPKKLDASGQQKWRVVVDYRKLNDISVGDAYPLPNIEDILDRLGQATYFSTLDLASGFHQIQMDPKDKAKTAFTTPHGHYEFQRMPFGLKNAPATFQRLMNTVLIGLKGIKSFVYLDDIVIYGNSLEHHNQNLREVFQKLREHNLKLQPDKCEFLRNEVAYLGHIITDKGVQPNPDKIKAISEIKTPKEPKDIKSFLGLVGYYRKFIPQFSHIAKPLTTLLKKDQKFTWTSKCEESFQKLKNSLITKPILQYPNFDEIFLLTTDASNDAIGSILSQGEIGKDLPIAYYSRTLNKAEKNYSTTEKELLAIVDSVKHFRPYLFGTKFIILTDHKPLTYLMNCKDPSSRLVRWRLKLLEYTYEIKYKPGKTNKNADALSRPILHINDELNDLTNDILTFDDFQLFHQQNITIKEPEIDKTPISKVKNIVIPIACDILDSNLHIDYVKRNFPNTSLGNHKPSEIITLRLPCQTIYLVFIKNFTVDSATYKDLFNAFKNLKLMLDFNKTTTFTVVNPILQNSKIQYDTFKSLLQYLFLGIEYKILNQERVLISDPQEITRILEENHDSPLAGHQGFHRTYDNIKQFYYWDNMKKTIQDYIQKCKTCQTSKVNFKPNRSPMLITTTSSKFCDQIAMDIVGPLPETQNGNRFILTLQDDLTKFIQAYALPEHNAQIVAIHFLKFCTQFGFPDSILSDQGKEFTSATFKEINKLIGTKHKLASPYHPQTNGALERTHLTLKDYFKCYVSKDGDDWDEYLNFAIYSYNSHLHKATSKTPFELVFGQLPRIPNFFKNPRNKPNYSDLAQEIASKLQNIREVAKENQIKSKEKSKQTYDKSHHRQYQFNENDLVLLQNLQAKNTSKQLKPGFLGPYKIIQIHNNNTASIQITKNKIRTYHFNMLKPYVSDSQNESDNDENEDPSAD